MNREEIMEGLKDIHSRFYAFTDYRKTLEACLKLLESENALIDRVLEIIKEKWTECDFRYGEVNEIRVAMNTAKDIYSAVEALKEGEQE